MNEKKGRPHTKPETEFSRPQFEGRPHTEPAPIYIYIQGVSEISVQNEMGSREHKTKHFLLYEDMS